jgi:hypothetical protein
MLLVFIGERLIGAGTSRYALSGLGVLLVLGVLARRAMLMNQTSGERKATEKVLVGLYTLSVASLILYFAQSDLIASKDSSKLSGALAALWPAVWLAAAAPILLVEMAYAAVARAPRLELARIHDALYAGLGLAGALVFAFSITYVAAERDKKVDLSYFRTAKAGEATKKLVAALDATVEVSLFFPSANEVRSQVQGYFDDLKAESKFLEVRRYDYALDPVKAKELGVSGNGMVVFKKGGRKEIMSVGLELEAARTQLSNLDKEVNKRISQVARPQRTVFMTYGHGERTDAPTGGDTDKRGTIRDVKELLVQQGYLVRNLGAADGLAADVPSDAALVLTIGPQKPFLPEETAAMERYLDKGGRWFLALDPDNGDMKELTALVALRYLPTTLANDQVYARKTQQPSDRTNIATGSYSSHASVTTLSKLGMRAPMILLGAGAIEEIEAKDRPQPRKDLAHDFTVRSHMATWNELNGNFIYDGGPTATIKEQRRIWNLACAVVRKRAGNKPADETRALVVGDSDLLTDGVVGNPGNAYFVLDGVKWLLGDEALTGEVSSEVDVPVAHTRKQDVAWFYGTIVLAPSLCLILGKRITRRRVRKERA